MGLYFSLAAAPQGKPGLGGAGLELCRFVPRVNGFRHEPPGGCMWRNLDGFTPEYSFNLTGTRGDDEKNLILRARGDGRCGVYCEKLRFLFVGFLEGSERSGGTV